MKMILDKLDAELSKRFPPLILPNKKKRQTYLKRWQICQDGKVSVYMHRFLGEDPRQTLHPHTKWMMTIGLWGSYFEETKDGEIAHTAPWVRVFDHTLYHRIRVPEGQECWTLCIAGADANTPMEHN